MKRNTGFTLLEITIAVAIFTVVMGTLFALSLGIGDTAQIQSITATSYDEARRALDTIATDLRQASRSSVNWAQLPGETLTYRVATDLDGNGLAVSTTNKLELSPVRTISRDTNDLVGDQQRANQLIINTGNQVRVLANNLSPDAERVDVNGTFGPAQDVNQNGRLDQGLYFEAAPNNGIRITMQTQGTTRKNQVVRTDIKELVYPRN